MTAQPETAVGKTSSDEEWVERQLRGIKCLRPDALRKVSEIEARHRRRQA